MTLTVNGDSMEVEPDLTIRALIDRLGLAAGPVAVERNGELVRRREHDAVRLNEGDVIEIVHFVGGG